MLWLPQCTDAAGEAMVDIATAAVTAVPDEAKKDIVVAAVRDASASGCNITSEEVTRGLRGRMHYPAVRARIFFCFPTRTGLPPLVHRVYI
jgi:hypothetical protein